MNRVDYPRTVKLFVFSMRVPEKLFQQLYLVARAMLAGFWLGILKKKTFDLIDQFYYERTKSYNTEEYNNSGLYSWEQAMTSEYFSDCRTLLVGGAGGGREVLALLKAGYEVDGFECHPGLTALANRLLEQNGFSPVIQLTPRDYAPTAEKQYDGIIVGWAAYMLIQGREQRLRFLEQVRPLAKDGAPILLSFFTRAEKSWVFRLTYNLGNCIRLILGRRRLDLGDTVEYTFVHHFTEQELAGELNEGGFELKYYKRHPYGHAVAYATTAVESDTH